MPVSSLQELASDFCEFIDAPAPVLQVDSRGVFAFSTTVRDVEIILTHAPAAHGDVAKAYVFFGALPADQELAVLRNLLEANFHMFEPQAPTFSREPATDRIVLQYVLPLSAASGQALWYGIQPLVDAVLKWRVDFRLAEAPAPSSLAAVAGLGARV